MASFQIDEETGFARPGGFHGELLIAKPFPWAITRPALDKALELRNAESSESLGLRLSVAAGGCSGLRYQMIFDDTSLENDATTAIQGLTLRCDSMSAPYLINATVHYVESLEKIGFVIENPNSQGGCACGDSFN